MGASACDAPPDQQTAHRLKLHRPLPPHSPDHSRTQRSATRVPDPVIISRSDHSQCNGENVSALVQNYESAPPGLYNLGNTCYLNSVLQILYYTLPLRQAVLNYQPPSQEESSGLQSFANELACEVQCIFRALDNATESLARSGTIPSSPASSLPYREGLEYISPRGLVLLLRNDTRCPEFDAQGQQDAQEFLRFLLDKLNDAFHAAAERDRHRKLRLYPSLSELSPSRISFECPHTAKVSPQLLHRPTSTTSSSTDPLPSDSASPSNGSVNNAMSSSLGNDSGNSSKRPRLGNACVSHSSDTPKSEPNDLTANLRHLRTSSEPSSSSPDASAAFVDEGNFCHPPYATSSSAGEMRPRGSRAGTDAYGDDCSEKDRTNQKDPGCAMIPSPVNPPLSKKPRLCGRVSVIETRAIVDENLVSRFRSNIISELFQGTAQTVTRCMQCEHANKRAESYLDVSLPVEVGKSLTWSLATHGKDEIMDGSNKYSCDYCCTYQEARQHWRISKIPPLFTVHLKLFAFASGRPLGAKVAAAMPCPFRLQLRKWCTEDCEQRDFMYHLTSVIVHDGGSSSSGHYYAYIKVPRIGWHCFDDGDVTVTDEEEIRRLLFTSLVSRTTAYLLFYEQEAPID